MAQFESKHPQAEPFTDDEFVDVDVTRKRRFDIGDFRSNASNMKEQTYAYVDEVSQYARNASARFSTRQLRFAFAGAAFVILFLFMFGRGVGGHAMAAFGVTTSTSASFALAMQETGPWKKPTGFKIVGLVFCEFSSFT